MIHLKNITNVKPKCEPRKKNVKKDRKKKKREKTEKMRKVKLLLPSVRNYMTVLHHLYLNTSAPALLNWRENTIVRIAPDSKFKINHFLECWSQF